MPRMSSELRGEILAVLSPGFGGTRVPAWLRRLLVDGLGAVTLFGSNVPDLETAARVVEEIRAINPDCVISIDEEAGDVTRIFAHSGSPLPSPALLGRVGNPLLTLDVYQELGRHLASLDIDLTFAPVADLATGDRSPIVGVRAFGSDPKLVSEHVSAAIRGLHWAGTGACVKHFPGHGRCSVDSHRELPVLRATREQLMLEDMRPFRAAIAYGVDAVMIGHLIAYDFDALPASQSAVIMRDLLRHELGFEGAIITDALDMGALGGVPNIGVSARRAVVNGADLLCLSGLKQQGPFVDACLREIGEAVHTGELDRADLRQAGRRTAALRRSKPPALLDGRIDANALRPGLVVRGEVQLPDQQVSLVTREADPTIAAGTIAWGLRPALEAAGVRVLRPDLTSASLVVQFRDAWRNEDVLAELRDIAQRRPDAVFVDMGWPTIEFQPPRIIRTFGGTLPNAEAAVAELLPTS